MKELFQEYELQSNDSISSFKFDDLFENYDELCHSPFFQKLYKLILYMLTLTTFTSLGLNFDKFHYFKIEKEAFLKCLFKGPDFIISLLKTLTYLCQRGYQCILTGSLDPIYHSGSKYEQWLDQSLEIKRKSKFVTNAEAHGFTKELFCKELDDLIIKGECIYKHACRLGAFEKKIICFTLNDLKLIKGNDIARNVLSETQEVPFAILVTGGSKIAKSLFQDLIFSHFGKIHNLPIGEEYKYVRRLGDKHWNGQHTYQWGLQMDDITFLKPKYCPQGDTSTLELLAVVNGVAFQPPKAVAEEKALSLARFKLVVASTNQPDLNAYEFYNNELAVRRRLPHVIELQIKEEYSSDGVTIDPTKIPPLNENTYPDYWTIIVKHVIPASDNLDNQRARLRTDHTFNNIYDFIRWLNSTSLIIKVS